MIRMEGFKKGLSASRVKPGLNSDLNQSTFEHKASVVWFLSEVF